MTLISHEKNVNVIQNICVLFYSSCFIYNQKIQFVFSSLYLDIMWKPEEEDVEDQLGAEQAEGELDDPGDHEGSMKTDGFPLRPIIFHFIFISFLFQDTNFSLNCIIDFDQF